MVSARLVMNRRAALQLIGGVAVAGVPSRAFQDSRRDRIVIAGAGILGASIAYQLAKRGASVTVLERSKPAAGATANSFAWINANKQPYDYFMLSVAALGAWHDLHREIGVDLPVLWGGSVAWTSAADRVAREHEALARFQSWGYPIYSIDEDRLHALEPNIVPGRVAAATYTESEGNADPVGVTELMLARAVQAGAQVRYPAEITGIDIRNGQLRSVRTIGDTVPADVLVVACGVDTPRVAAMADVRVRLTRSAGILVHTQPQPRCVNRIVLSPIGNIKQKMNGRIVTGLDFAPARDEETSRESGERFLQRMAAVLPPLKAAPFDKVTLGLRPMPADGYPVIGFPEGRRDLYITVMHSGITLAPLVGRLAAAEILDGVRVHLLAPFRIERFR
jgi:glycine/D-amino acid oxidase-like deaminating enzyme